MTAHITPTADVGVIVGRFQVPDLHPGHIEFFDRIIERHRKVIVVLGCAPLVNTMRDPLDYHARMLMIQSIYPSVIITRNNDHPIDAVWSRNLDSVISDLLSPTQTAILYGSRDSFIPHYSGRFDTLEIETIGHHSGTELRKPIGLEVHDDEMWRRGVIWASRNRFPTAYTTVDAAIFNTDLTHILLGKKPGEERWRLPGGFSDPCSTSFEEDAVREVLEETGLNYIGPQYLKSFTIDDWRYRKGPDCIKTLLFAGIGVGDAVAGDDLAVVEWLPVSTIDPAGSGDIMKAHLPLTQRAFMWLGKARSND